MVYILYRGWRWELRHHWSFWGVQNRQDLASSYTLCDCLVVSILRRWRRQGTLHRHWEHFVRYFFTLILISRPERIKQIASRFGLDPNEVLENIMVGRAFTVDTMNQLIVQAAGAMIQDQFALLVIDSIMAPFRVDYSGRGELSERQ